MVSLADEVLPLVRTRSDVHRWSAANAYGFRVHQAVTLLQDAADTQPAGEVLAVTQRALASALKVIDKALAFFKYQSDLTSGMTALTGRLLP